MFYSRLRESTTGNLWPARPVGHYMTGAEVRAVFEQMLPQDVLNRMCQQCGVIERQRKLNLAMLVRAMIVAAGTPGGAYQADVLRAYLESEVPRVTRAAFYRWFDEPLERFMEALAQRALAYARAQQVELPGPLSGVKDWYIVNSTTIKVRDALLEEFPGTGDYAALKGHKILSVGCGAPVRYHVSPAREHASPHLHIDESWPGYGLLPDRAYASLARLRRALRHPPERPREAQGRLHRPGPGDPGVLSRHRPRCPPGGGNPRPRWPGH
jgi:hypothetical protein